MDRVGQLKTPFLPQHHQGDRGNRLGHGIMRKIVVAHGLITLAIHETIDSKCGYTCREQPDNREFSGSRSFPQVRTNSATFLSESGSGRIYFHDVLPRYSWIEIPHGNDPLFD